MGWVGWKVPSGQPVTMPLDAAHSICLKNMLPASTSVKVCRVGVNAGEPAIR
ncbi:Hypothetical protein PFR_J18_2261 [Propionibacterium freudenreichii]|nr:Hypothetical protein PFR_J18_2261 [Propionibacterium freudenreichii]